ncbi:hypothetical protein QQF64_004349 [Cirrhinus molitorella]|uniref:Uncharacterized protein n=1 Tax=Cirrhinus molitorella TaxID=172907 RepID=A0ABR3MJ47_9TELE
MLRKADVQVATFTNLPRFILYSHSMLSHLDTGHIIPWPRQWPAVTTCPKTGFLLACLQPRNRANGQSRKLLHTRAHISMCTVALGSTSTWPPSAQVKASLHR